MEQITKLTEQINIHLKQNYKNSRNNIIYAWNKLNELT